MVTVDSWSSPTTVVAAPGALQRVARSWRQPALIITDAKVWEASDFGARLVATSGRGASVLARSPDECDLDFLIRVSGALADRPEATVVAFGGGSVLDPAKVAVCVTTRSAAAGPVPTSLLEELLSTPGLKACPAPPTDGVDLVAIPTTLGTGSEVSPIAVLRRAETTVMVAGPSLRPRVAVLDPEATASLPGTQLAAGLVEPLSRSLVPAIAGDRLALGDALAGCLARLALDLMGQPADEQWRLTAALLSTQTHTGFLALGRSPVGHVLWPIVTEAMTLLRLDKPAALAALLPAWLTGVAEGWLPRNFGSPQRLAEVLGPDHSTFLRHLGEALSPYRPTLLPDTATEPTSAELAGLVSQRVAQRWPMFLPSTAAPAVAELTLRAFVDAPSC